MLQPGADPVRKVSIIPRGRALGVTLSTPESDRYGYDANYLRGRIIGALGGMAAEQEVFNIVTTGAESDLEMVTRIARSMVGRWGMSERIGTLSVLPAEGDPRMAGISDGLLDAVDEEVRRITDECYAEARRLLKENRDKLDAIVAQLLVHESLDEPEIYAAAGIDAHGRHAVARADARLKALVKALLRHREGHGISTPPRRNERSGKPLSTRRSKLRFLRAACSAEHSS